MGPRPPKLDARNMAANGHGALLSGAQPGRTGRGGAKPLKPAKPAAKPLVVEHRALSRSKPVHELETAPLAADVIRDLGTIASALRDMPRSCARDMQELVHWLQGHARRIEGIAAKRIALPAPRPTPALPAAMRSIARAIACEVRAPATTPRHRDRQSAWRRRLVELGQLLLPL